jgi:lipopolysaccharide transport system permease protein
MVNTVIDSGRETPSAIVPRGGKVIAPPRVNDLWENLRQVPAYAPLFKVFIWRNISTRYKQSVLGVLWIVLQPLISTFVIFFMFNMIGANTSDGPPPALFLFVGLMSWQFFSRGVQEGTASLAANGGILTKIYFPRIILPLAAIISGWFDMLVMICVLIVMLFAWGSVPPERVVLLPLFILFVSCAALSMAVLLAPINVLYRDVSLMLPFILQFGMYASPVLYATHYVPSGWRILYYANPMSTLVEAVRWSILRDSTAPNFLFLAVNMITVLVLLLVGLLVYQKTEALMIDRM